MQTDEISQRAEQALGVPEAPCVLTVSERAALLECEGMIREGMNAFFRVGCALQRIRDSKLYRESYATFEAYCEGEWDMSDRFARHLRSAADVVSVLLPEDFVALPATESQARPIAKLPREEWCEAWEEVVATAGGKITASHVTNVVQRRLNRMAGLGTDTEELRSAECGVRIKEPKGQSEPIDLPDLSSREKRIGAVAREAQLRLRELVETYALTDTGLAGHLLLSIHRLDDLQEHLVRKEAMLANRADRTEGAL